MDRTGASLESCVDSMKKRLNINPFILQLPIGSAETFSGVIDLISLRVNFHGRSFLFDFLQRITWADEMGETVNVENLSESDPLYKKAMAAREQLIETVANYNDSIAVSIIIIC